MTRPTPTTAMLLAAGLGTRMQPITIRTPKPMVNVGGKPLIDWALDQAAAAGVTRAVINVHHLADQILAHVGRRTLPAVLISDETDRLLDTGGGVVKALPLLGTDPIVVMNTDGILTDGRAPALRRLFDRWTSDVDCVMLVHPRETAHGFDGPGDFFVADGGGMTRRGTAPSAPYVYAGAYVIDLATFQDAPNGPFSANIVWDRLISNGRMRAVIHDGDWFHVGTSEAVEQTTQALARMGLAS